MGVLAVFGGGAVVGTVLWLPSWLTVLRARQLEPDVERISTAARAYLFLAVGPAYGARGLVRVIQSGVAAVAVGALVLGYRFLQLLITLTFT